MDVSVHVRMHACKQRVNACVYIYTGIMCVLCDMYMCIHMNLHIHVYTRIIA